MPDIEIDVSVVVPARNAQKTLPRCLSALRDQSLRVYADMEVVVADCGSGDRTHEIALEYQRADPALIRIHRQTGADAFQAAKTGLALARGKYVAFCGADDIVPIDMFGTLYEACEDSGSLYAGSGGASIWAPALGGMLVRRAFLLAHGLPVKTGYDRAEQLAAYDTLRRLVSQEDLPLFRADWVKTLRGICLEEFRSCKTSAAFYEKMISLANEPQAEEVMAHARRDALDKAHRKFYDTFARRDWIKLEKRMKRGKGFPW